MKDSQITFGDKVRIRSIEITETLKLAGKTGIVHGRTTPSVTGINVIGNVTDDFAIGVNIEEQGVLWFTEDVVEFIDHSPGMTATAGGREFIRDENGEWHESKQC